MEANAVTVRRESLSTTPLAFRSNKPLYGAKDAAVVAVSMNFLEFPPCFGCLCVVRGESGELYDDVLSKGTSPKMRVDS